MKILQVVTLVSPDFAYGGPLRVALNHCEALRSNGHDVTLLAMQRGVDSLSSLFKSADVKLFAARHIPFSPPFAGLISIPMLQWFAKHHREYDVVHVHIAREIEVASMARIRTGQGPLVVQTHGMIGSDRRFLSRALDLSLLTTVLSQADAVLYLTEHERLQLAELTTGHANLIALQNGVPVPHSYEPPSRSEVLFMARLHARKNPVMFAEVAISLCERFPRTQFSILGPDGGQASAVRQLIGDGASRSIHLGTSVPAEQTAERLKQCSIYVLPSINEPFPMSTLEAMAVGRPVVITNSNGLADLVNRAECGLVVDATKTAVASAITRLLQNRDEAAEMGRRAQDYIRDVLSLDTVGSQLIDVYTAVLARHREGTYLGADNA